MDEGSHRGLEHRLFDGENRVVFLEPLRVDGDVVPLWRLSDANDADTVEEIDGPPDGRSGGPGHVDELGDREFRLVSVRKQTEYLVSRPDAEDVDVAP
ncbi:hypothetical protein HTIA_1309 [Halorhabdus tiamatea SARL4B]|uniref:Uncharacterized protein n=1 Tax=Halorhabdus tiamatea SARL4B TaxID=1033806 RepID=S6D0G8_9EURY|nr:hypothetical protein HTIA_1309 [Halorhabdus tiamatea SARL4B]